MPLLEVTDLHAGYGDVPILHGISLTIENSEIVSLVGSNGAGKTTFLRSLSRAIQTKGSIRFDGTDVTKLAPHEFVCLGIAHVPEGRQLFPTMTTLENLNLGVRNFCSARERKSRLEQVYALFPRLAERTNQLAGTMSGGEQQMVAIGRALMARPRLLLLDEPSLGLAPIVVKSVFTALAEVRSRTPILLVEQSMETALALAQRVYVMSKGAIVFSGSVEALRARDDVRTQYLEV